jgi:hypothetical protein
VGAGFATDLSVGGFFGSETLATTHLMCRDRSPSCVTDLVDDDDDGVGGVGTTTGMKHRAETNDSAF